MELNEIDNILNDLGMVNSIPASAVPSFQGYHPAPSALSDADVLSNHSEGNEDSAFTDADFDEILADNGFTVQTENIDLRAEYNDDEDDEEYEETDLAEALQSFEEAIEEHTESVLTPISDNALLPQNSGSLLVDEATSRFSGAAWFQEVCNARVIIAGVGGIGSNVAFQLARMTPACITLYDDDTVETVNMAGQLFSLNDVGSFKVDAITSMIRNYTTLRSIYGIAERYTRNSQTGDIMICGFDNMQARTLFFESWKRHISNRPPEERKKCLFIDGRLSMDVLQILCIQGDDDYNIRRYQTEFLFTDSEADATVCSMKQTTYLACMIGSLIVNLFTNFIANTLDPIIPFDLPFFTEYDAQNVIFKTKN